MKPAYYNEIDQFAAQMLRNLIVAGHIAPGQRPVRGTGTQRAHRRNVESEGPFPYSETYSVMCDASTDSDLGGCGSSGGYFETNHEAIAAWNLRAPQAAEQERKPLDTRPVVSDDELAKAFAGTNFGSADHRSELHVALLKKASGYHCGHTITTIMRELRLIGAGNFPTKKGRKLISLAYHSLMVGGP